MSLFELFMIYAISWWMILFMVLPWGVKLAAKPVAGHAASAPVAPRIRRKLLITSLLAFIVPILAYGVNEARAESGIYTTKVDGKGSDCVPADVTTDASVNAVDKDATLGGSSTADMGVVPTYLDGRTDQYSNNEQLDRLGAGVINVGVAETDTRTGEVRINGTSVGSHAADLPSHCK